MGEVRGEGGRSEELRGRETRNERLLPRGAADIYEVSRVMSAARRVQKAEAKPRRAHATMVTRQDPS